MRGQGTLSCLGMDYRNRGRTEATMAGFCDMNPLHNEKEKEETYGA